MIRLNRLRPGAAYTLQIPTKVHKHNILYIKMSNWQVDWIITVVGLYIDILTF